MVEPTHLENIYVKLDHESPRRDEHKKIFELPPPRKTRDSVMEGVGIFEVTQLNSKLEVTFLCCLL